MEYCSSLASVTLLCKNVYAWFSGLASINEITLSENVTSIGNSAFENCSGFHLRHARQQAR